MSLEWRRMASIHMHPKAAAQADLDDAKARVVRIELELADAKAVVAQFQARLDHIKNVLS